MLACLSVEIRHRHSTQSSDSLSLFCCRLVFVSVSFYSLSGILEPPYANYVKYAPQVCIISGLFGWAALRHDRTSVEKREFILNKLN